MFLLLSFCLQNTNKIPSSITQVPVNINDNGTLYKATFYAGAMLAAINGTTLKPAIDWIAIGILRVQTKALFLLFSSSFHFSGFLKKKLQKRHQTKMSQPKLINTTKKCI